MSHLNVKGGHMALNLLTIQPHVVSRDLSGYITLIYGPAKIGKTTFGTQMPDHLLLAFEKGYNALQGAMVQDIPTWAIFKQAVRELKKPEVKEVYKSLIIDTVDFAADACQKYVCNQLGIDNIGDGGWANNGWTKYKKEFEGTFRELTQLGYAIVFISHDKEKTIKLQNAQEYQQISSSLQSSALSIVENMCDIIGYAHPVPDASGGFRRVLTLRSNDNTIRCGCRFKYIDQEIDFNYESLRSALTKAIDKEAQETSNAYVTDDRIVTTEEPSYDYESLLTEFNSVAQTLMQQNLSNQAKIVAIVEKYLGKGKKIAETTPSQAELIALILDDIKSDLLSQ